MSAAQVPTKFIHIVSCWRTAVARRPRHELRHRRLPQSQRSPARDAAWSGSGGAAFARSSSQSAHETLLLTIKRKAFHLGRRPLIAKQHRHFGMPSLRATFSRRCASTTSPSLRGKYGILGPNPRMLTHIRSAASFLRRFLA